MICDICQEKFLPRDHRQRICSAACRIVYKQRWFLKSVGREELSVRTSKERWIHKNSGYVLIKVDGELVYEHRVLAEKALGKPLPKGTLVHHMRGTADNYAPFDLVICPNQAYHLLLHRRMKETRIWQG